MSRASEECAAEEVNFAQRPSVGAITTDSRNPGKVAWIEPAETFHLRPWLGAFDVQLFAPRRVDDPKPLMSVRENHLIEDSACAHA